MPVVEEAPVKSENTSDPLPQWITLDYVMGKFDPAVHPSFVKIPVQWADREGMYMRKEAYEDFLKMATDAKAQGINMQIKSAARNFDYQKGIWERKWNGITTLEGGAKATDYKYPDERAKKILLYSSMPGTSRHHWGTDIDLNSFVNSYFDSGVGLKLYNWMQEHAHEYGYCQPYTDKMGGRTGYEEEKWHWTYTPLSMPLTTFAMRNMNDHMISGFEGSKTAPNMQMLKNYILGISPKCQ